MATAGHHRRVDAAFSAASLGDAQSYGAFLRAQAAAQLPVEAALAARDIAAIVPDWPMRRRGDLLRADLAALGLDVPPPAGTVALADDAASLGALYVLEGSRLGGALLQRQVAPGLPASFLRAQAPAAWRTLLALLDARLQFEGQRQAAIAAAGSVFDLFETSAQRHLPTPIHIP